jgi:hypothetical protein
MNNRTDLRSALAGLVLAGFVPGLAVAQGLDAEGARETIIDAPVSTEVKPVAGEDSRIAAAIARSDENGAEIRRRFSVGEIEIVLVEGLADAASPLADAIAGHGEEIAALRKEIEGSAIFYHAIDSLQILLRDVVAVEFGENGAVTIFVAAPAAG